jgi:DNA gyrase/topoisomerase IV subunit B
MGSSLTTPRPQTLEQDKLFLDQQLSVFAESITTLQSEIEGSCKRSISCNEEAQAAREQMEQSMTVWMSSTRTEAEQMARNLIEAHRDQMAHVCARNAVETAPMPDCR